MWLQNTVRVQNCYVIILLIVYEDILIPRNPGNGWRMLLFIQIFFFVESIPLLVILEDCLEMIDSIFLSDHSSTAEMIDQHYVAALEVYCLLKQRMIDLKKSWRNVLKISFNSHREQTSK